MNKYYIWLNGPKELVWAFSFRSACHGPVISHHRFPIRRSGLPLEWYKHLSAESPYPSSTSTCGQCGGADASPLSLPLSPTRLDPAPVLLSSSPLRRTLAALPSLSPAPTQIRALLRVGRLHQIWAWQGLRPAAVGGWGVGGTLGGRGCLGVRAGVWRREPRRWRPR